MAKKPQGLTLQDVLAGQGGANKARLAAAMKEAEGLKSEAKKDKGTVDKAVPTVAKQMKELKSYTANQFNNTRQYITKELKTTNSLIDKVRADISKLDVKLSDMSTKQDKALGMLGDITTAIKAIQQSQKSAAAPSSGTGAGGASIIGGVADALSGAAGTAGAIKTAGDMGKAATSTSKWGKFMMFLEKKAPNLFAKVGVRLMSMGAGMAIPGPGWVWTAVNVVGSLSLAWEVYTYWQEFSGATTTSSGDKGPSKSKDIEDLQRKAQGGGGGGGGGAAPSAAPSATGGAAGGVTQSTGAPAGQSGPVEFSGSNKPILDTIKKRESGGNYQAQAKGSSASGAYQFIDSTWQSLTKKYGVGTEYSRAVMAPPQIQDQIADKYISEILSKNNNDVSKVPLVWYTGNSQGKISAAAMAANGGLTPEKYQQMWLADYAKMGGKVQSAGGQTPNMVPELPRPSMPGAGGAGGVNAAPQGASTPTGGYGPRQAALDSANGQGGMVTLTTASGKSFQVAAQYAQQFQGFVNELEASGYKINSIGGFSDRNVAGTNQKSYHAQGAAIDINPGKNPMGSQLITDMPQGISAMAAKYGLGWGGDWRSKKDAMHFSAAAGEGGSAQISRGSGESLVGGLPGGQVASFGPEGAGIRQMGTGSIFGGTGGMGGPMAMRSPGMGGAFGGPIGGLIGGAISSLTGASGGRSGGSIFSGVDYQSNGKPVINPDGSINWGDPDNPADFARASQAMQRGAGRKTEAAAPAAVAKKKSSATPLPPRRPEGLGEVQGPNLPMGPELPPLRAAQLAALESDDDSVGYRGKAGQILEYNMKEAATLDAERKKDAERAAEKAQQERYAAMERDDAEQGAAARLAQDAVIAKQNQAGVSVANQKGTAKTLRNSLLGYGGPEASRVPPGTEGAPSKGSDGVDKHEMPDAGVKPDYMRDLFDINGGAQWGVGFAFGSGGA